MLRQSNLAPLLAHLQGGRLLRSSWPSHSHPVDQDSSVGGAGTSTTRHRSAGTPRRPSRGLLAASPTTSPHQPLLTFQHRGCHTTVMVPVLSRALAGLLHRLGHDAGPFSLHSFCRGGATAAYRQGLDQIDIKHQGLWISDTFWQYITSSCSTTSPLAEGLARAIYATSATSTTASSTSSS